VHDLLRAIWNEPRAPNPPPRSRRDWALVAVLVPTAVLEGILRPELPWRIVSMIVVAGLVPTLLWRRSHPLLMVTIAFAAGGLISILTADNATEMHTMVYLLLLPYSLFRWGSGREVVIGSGIFLTSICLSMVLDRTSLGDAIGGFTVLLLALTLALALRFRVKARVRELDQVKLLERERLARDLHDTVAHHVSAIVIRAQAGLATSASRPDAAADALRVIEAEASRALAEMRTLVRVLRQNQPADLVPSPSIGDLEWLASWSRTGPAVDVEVSGDVDGLPASVGSTIYHLAQESVTNARRHARHATRVEVRVATDDTSVHLRVSDDGDAGPVRSNASPGYGLIGMTERAELLGGTLRAGPNPDRGWTVIAVLPRTGVPA
jgi:signal transduction histidine kinase